MDMKKEEMEGKENKKRGGEVKIMEGRERLGVERRIYGREKGFKKFNLHIVQDKGGEIRNKGGG